MKKIMLLFCISVAQFSFSQTSVCSTARQGKFELLSPASGRTLIERTATTQTERNDSLGIESLYVVTWIDSWTYELRDKKLIRGDRRFAGQSGDVIKVQIVKVQGQKITVRTSSNFSDRIVERELTKLN